MARSLITPVTITANSSGAGTFDTDNMVKMTTDGLYIKTSGIDATKLVFMVSHNSSKLTSAANITFVSGSSAGNYDFQPGKYSTLNNLNVRITAVSTGEKRGMGKRVIFVPETARFKDTDGYIKINVSSKLSSVRNSAASLGTKIGAILLP